MLKACRVAALTALLVACPAALASVAEDAQALMNRGQYAEALKKLEQHLQKNPQDAEARFARGLALVKLNRNDDAVRAFADLTRDYPQLPEPYNNLAVLYAQKGEYEKARDALEAALATHPSYATAHENLGDIYAALAGAAYNRALMLDQANPGLRRKLSLITQLEGGGETSVASAAPAPRAEPPRAATPAVAAAPAEPAVVTTPVTPSTTVAPAAGAAGTVDAATSQAAQNLVQQWARAWSAQDLAAYFAAYDEGFTPEGGLTREAWETQRRDRISRPKRIVVKAINPEIAPVAADRVRVSFTQEYESDAFSDTVGKVLELRQAGGTWKIVREYTR